MIFWKNHISLLFRPSVIRGPWIKPPLVVYKNKTLFLAYAVVISDYQLDRIFISEEQSLKIINN